MAEDEMVGQHHQHNEHEFEQAPGFGDRQQSLVYCSPWGHKESDTTEPLNWMNGSVALDNQMACDSQKKQISEVAELFNPENNLIKKIPYLYINHQS